MLLSEISPQLEAKREEQPLLVQQRNAHVSSLQLVIGEAVQGNHHSTNRTMQLYYQAASTQHTKRNISSHNI